jgi:hypothetical protein
MKKALFLVLIAAMAMPMFADDALVMPAGVIRTYLTGAYATINKAYDSDSKAQDLANKITVGNLGAAVEFGINNWITAAAQWAPGANISSKVDGVDKATLNDTADIFLGAKLQIVGPKAPVQNDTMRFAFAAGVKVPTSAPDWKQEATNFATSKTFLASPADNRVLGIGGRGYFDYIINEMFFLNLYSEFIAYPAAVDLKDYNLTGYSTWATVQGLGATTYNPTIKYGSDLTLEFEPHFQTMLGEGLQFSAGLPVTYKTTAGITVDGDAIHPLTAAGGFPVESAYTMSVGPNVSMFFQKTFLPIELKLGYTLPVAGKNDNATNIVTLQVKVYAKFY